MALGRISVFIDTSLRNACRQFAAENGNTESDVLRAALAIGLQSLKHSNSPAGKRKALIDDVIGELEDSIIGKEFWKARTTVCQLATGGDPLSDIQLLETAMYAQDFARALQLIDRIEELGEMQDRNKAQG